MTACRAASLKPICIALCAAQLAVTNVDLTRFGASLGRYARQIIEFLTFVTELAPYPFAAWPAES